MPLTPTETRELLTRLEHQPKRFLGQNFLVDGNIVRKSLALAEIAPGDTVVEVGPGLGTLTSALLAAGATVWAVEKDHKLHEHLAATLAREYATSFHLMEGDAVEHPLAAFQPAEGQAFKVVANLPYAISTPWMDAVLGGPLPARMVLMLQQEAAQRYAANPGTKQFSAISIFLQAAYEFAPGHKVPAACFHPRPDVESYLLHLVLRPRPVIFQQVTKSLIRACFQQRRKQIGAILRDKLGPRADQWLAELAKEGLGARSRAEEIPLSLWTKLTTD